MASKQIQSLQKQNDSIFSSLHARNITFERVLIPEGIDETEHIRLLTDENNQLKEVVKANKPAPIPKEEKKPQIQQQSQPVKKDEKTTPDKNEEEEEVYEEPVKKFDTITNMEDMKRAFFNGDYPVFEELFKAHPFNVYKMNYKYNSDKDGAPDFSAKNLLKGFVRNFDDYRKYFMICFRCMKAETSNTYRYDSYWIVNTNSPVQEIIGSTWEDFEPDESIQIDKFIELIKKIPETEEPVYVDGYTCIGESYVH